MGQVALSIGNGLSSIPSITFDLAIDPGLLERVIRVILWRNCHLTSWLLYSFLGSWFGKLSWGFLDLNWVHNFLKIVLSDVVDQISFCNMALRSTRCHLFSLDAVVQKVEPGRGRDL